MIIGSHYAVHGGENNWTMFRSAFSINRAILTMLGSWGELGICGVIVISCYFMIEEGAMFRTKKIFLIILNYLRHSCE